MNALAHRVVLASGWTRRLIAFVAGACGALAMAPVDVVVAMVVPMTVAVWLIDGADGASGAGRHWPALRSAAGAGWWWGLGYFVAGLWWMGSAFLVEPDKFAWALPFGVLGLPAVAALYPALGFALARAVWLPGGGRVLSLAFGLGLSEWLRATLLTGFPWNEFGMAFGGSLVLGQAASLVGLHGLTLLAVAVFAAPATLVEDGFFGERRRGRVAAGLAALTLLALATFGFLRLGAPEPGTVAGVKIRIMQPNLTEDAAFTYANKDAILRRYLALSDRATSAGTSGLADVTHLIWPESAFPFILSREPDALNAIAAALPAGTVLVTGAARLEGRPGSPSAPARYFNAIQVVGRGGAVLDTYDKVHLVPFGEYLPFDDLLRRLGIQHFVHIPGGFSPGTRHHLLDVPGLPPVAPAICYEAIFPGEILPDAADARRAGLLVNVTNDSWFGRTAGPYQHLAQARLRTIETGLPMVRAAATGISAIIDPYGRELVRSALGVEDVIDGPLPSRIAPTVFAVHGRWLVATLFGALGTTILIASRVARRFPDAVRPMKLRA